MSKLANVLLIFYFLKTSNAATYTCPDGYIPAYDHRGKMCIRLTGEVTQVNFEI